MGLKRRWVRGLCVGRGGVWVEVEGVCVDVRWRLECGCALVGRLGYFYGCGCEAGTYV